MSTRTTGAYHLLRACTAGLLLAGCAGAGAGPTADADPTGSAGRPIAAAPATGAVTSPTVGATPAVGHGASPTPDRPDDSEEANVIGFLVEGGFTNQMRSLRIDAGGQALVEVSGRSARGQLDAARVEAIVAELDASGLFDADRTYPAPAGADQQRFEITYDGATIVAYDATVPPELTEAVRLLDAALRDVQR